MKFNWDPIKEEIKIWNGEGLCLPFWWRDDDAVKPTPELERLNTLSLDLQIPVHIAVIPKFATLELADFVKANHNITSLIHGWSHENHAPEGQKKAEFGAHRSKEEMKLDLQRSVSQMSEIFGETYSTIFVPPWNRVSPEIYPLLVELGISMISASKVRQNKNIYPGLEQINTHLEPISYKVKNTLVEPEIFIAKLSAKLHDRRIGIADNSEPFGYLTHHLAQNEDMWRLSETFLNLIKEFPLELFQAKTKRELV